ncbi:MAG: YjhG/YagF family D-xylonate dehydratase [Gemmatimonadota bacterium]|nr:YjhG/YagF family D-xylonate dehydratase [Gemmatimonadota bacterium]
MPAVSNPYLQSVLQSGNESVFEVRTRAPGPEGRLISLTEELVVESPSGDIFGYSQNAGMGWDPAELGRPEILILSTMGGIREPDGRPVALGYHTGHWEVGLLMREAALEIHRLGGIPFAGYCSDPCDGRTQGTTGMMDSLAYRNDAATVLRRLVRSLPTRKGVIGVATCDKGLPAMMIALAAMHSLPTAIVPGGVTLPPDEGEDAGKIQSVGVRLAHGEMSLSEVQDLGCRACATPGGGCQFLGTAATSQVVAEALGFALTHSALAPSGQAVWLDMALRSARAVFTMQAAGRTTADVITDAALHNAMVTHAAFGGSTNLLLHIPAVAYAAGRSRPTVDDWSHVNRQVPRLVDVLPNGPEFHPTVRAFLAGGVPEVMLHLRKLGLLETDALTISGGTLGENLDWWEGSERRARFRQALRDQDGIDHDHVIMDADRARARGLTSTVCFPTGNIAPEGSVVKSTAIDPSVVDEDGVYRTTGPVKVFTTERAAAAALKDSGPKRVKPGDVMVLIGRGPMGAGMEEIAQITTALKYLDFGKHVAVLTDARFSGFSTGACIGHIGPEALAGGPIGKLTDGDVVEIVIDRNELSGTINFVGVGETRFGREEGRRILADRASRSDLAPDADLPDDTRLWAALQNVGGGTWGGCVYDVDAIVQRLNGGTSA